MSFKNVVFLLCGVFLVASCNNIVERRPKFLPFTDWLFGQRCGICPPRFCDDDPAVILGYCCGCRPPGLQEFLPINCPPPPLLVCPIDGVKLCNDFEYMMNCCCS